MLQPRRFARQPRRAVILCWFLALLLAAGASAATKKPPLRPINLNSATSDELQQVPGIGPATADKILQMRKSYGAFKSVDDLLAIRGIGKKRLDKMRKYLTAGKPASPQRPAASNFARPATAKETLLPVKPKPPIEKAAAEAATPAPETETEEPR
jgi:competence protein ComEA